MIDEAGARARLAAQAPPPEVAALKARARRVNGEKEAAVRDQNFERAASLRDKERELQGDIRSKQEEWEKRRQSHRPVLGEEEISFIVSRWTGIPVTRLQEAETARLLRMEDELHADGDRPGRGDQGDLDGRFAAAARGSRIRAVRSARSSSPARRASERPSWRARWPSSCSPIESALIRVDMSEYMEKFSVSRLIGAPPGYVGYEDSGTLTKAVRRKPYSVILLDEIEKAHPDVFNILLQVLDEGHLTDNYGRVIDFKNTVVIMTSNVGARDITKTQVARLHERRRRKQNLRADAEKVKEELKNVFNPEFLNRLDDVIVFHPLDREHIAQIVSDSAQGRAEAAWRGGAARSSSPTRRRTSW